MKLSYEDKMLIIGALSWRIADLQTLDARYLPSGDRLRQQVELKNLRTRVERALESS